MSRRGPASWWRSRATSRPCPAFPASPMRKEWTSPPTGASPACSRGLFRGAVQGRARGGGVEGPISLPTACARNEPGWSPAAKGRSERAPCGPPTPPPRARPGQGTRDLARNLGGDRDDHSIPALALGAIQRGVGGAEEQVSREAVLGVAGHPE